MLIWNRDGSQDDKAGRLREEGYRMELMSRIADRIEFSVGEMILILDTEGIHDRLGHILHGISDPSMWT